jgi:hypothetical protein
MPWPRKGLSAYAVGAPHVCVDSLPIADFFFRLLLVLLMQETLGACLHDHTAWPEAQNLNVIARQVLAHVSTKILVETAFVEGLQSVLL